MQTTFELRDKSKYVNGETSTKSILVRHISCIDQEIKLMPISIGQYAWQFTVYVYNHKFTASSEAFDHNNEKLKVAYLKEMQNILNDLLRIWSQVNNKQLSINNIPCLS